MISNFPHVTSPVGLGLAVELGLEAPGAAVLFLADGNFADGNLALNFSGTLTSDPCPD